MLQSLFGIIVFIFLAWCFSSDRRVSMWRIAMVGMTLQFVIATLLLKVPVFQTALSVVNNAVLAIERATNAGVRAIFGFLGGGNMPFEVVDPAANYIMAFRALPLILIFSVLAAVLWHWRVLPLIIRGFSWALQKSLGISGAVGWGSASGIFVGMVESPLLIRAYLPKMSNSELFVVMSCGMATVAGTVMGLYASILGTLFENAIGHILVASVISAPAAIMLALIMRPGEAETELDATQIDLKYDSTLHAVSRGTSDGVQLLLMIVAMLVVFIALVDLSNQLLTVLPSVNGDPLTLQRILGWVFAPIAWLMGVPWSEAQTAGGLLGIKTILNEFLAYLQLVQVPQTQLSEHSRLIMTYALCGFANLGSLGILVGGMTTMCPQRSADILRLAPWTLVSGTLATCLTGAVVGIVM